MHHYIILRFVCYLCVCNILTPIIFRPSLILTKRTCNFILRIIFIWCLILTFWWNWSCIGFFNPIFLIFLKLVTLFVVWWVFLSENITVQHDSGWFGLIFLINKLNLSLYNQILINYSVQLWRFYLSLCIFLLFLLLRSNRRSLQFRFELNSISSLLTKFLYKICWKADFFDVLHWFELLNIESFCILLLDLITFILIDDFLILNWWIWKSLKSIWNCLLINFYLIITSQTSLIKCCTFITFICPQVLTILKVHLAVIIFILIVQGIWYLNVNWVLASNDIVIGTWIWRSNFFQIAIIQSMLPKIELTLLIIHN